MNKSSIALIIGALVLGLYFLTTKKEDSRKETQKLENRLADQPIEDMDALQTEDEKKSQKPPPSLAPSTDQKSNQIEPSFNKNAVQVIHQCARKYSFSSLSLIKSGDKISDLLKITLNDQPLNRVIDLENLHFIDETGTPLRFQILSKEESRFFRVDNEGLPIRIDPPEAFKGLNPQEQKLALINAYKEPKFSQSHDIYESPNSKVSIQATQVNGQIKDLQLFSKRSNQVGSLGCAVEESSSSILCKCL